MSHRARGNGNTEDYESLCSDLDCHQFNLLFILPRLCSLAEIKFEIQILSWRESETESPKKVRNRKTAEKSEKRSEKFWAGPKDAAKPRSEINWQE